MFPEIVEHRRERRRLRWIDRLFMLSSLGFLGWVAYAIFIADRRDLFYSWPSLFGTLSGLSRYLVYRVRAMPRVVAELRSSDPAKRERAWTVIEAHREELLGETVVPRTIHEPPLTELSRDALIERLQRAGDTDWRRILRVWFVIWVPLALLVFFATLFYVPDPTRSY